MIQQSDEHEYSVDVPALYSDDKPFLIGVDKIGGGTLGSSYTGTWLVKIYDNEELVDILPVGTGMPKTHEEVAKMAAEYYSEGMDTDETWPTYDRLTIWAMEAE